MNNISKDIIISIACNLDIKDISAWMLCSNKFNRCLSTEYLWKYKVEHDYNLMIKLDSITWHKFYCLLYSRPLLKYNWSKLLNIQQTVVSYIYDYLVTDFRKSQNIYIDESVPNMYREQGQAVFKEIKSMKFERDLIFVQKQFDQIVSLDGLHITNRSDDRIDVETVDYPIKIRLSCESEPFTKAVTKSEVEPRIILLSQGYDHFIQNSTVSITSFVNEKYIIDYILLHVNYCQYETFIDILSIYNLDLNFHLICGHDPGLFVECSNFTYRLTNGNSYFWFAPDNININTIIEHAQFFFKESE